MLSLRPTIKRIYVQMSFEGNPVSVPGMERPSREHDNKLPKLIQAGAATPK